MSNWIWFLIVVVVSVPVLYVWIRFESTTVVGVPEFEPEPNLYGNGLDWNKSIYSELEKERGEPVLDLTDFENIEIKVVWYGPE